MASRTEQSIHGDEDAGRPTLLLVAAAGICWTVAITLLFMADLAAQDELALQRVLFYITLPLAGLLTFVPLQLRLGLPGLALEGTAGTTLLLYSIAFVPPPTESLLSLPDTPVYLLLFAGLFWSAAALAQPLIFAAGVQLFSSRLRKFDLRRVRRQAYGVGLLLSGSAVLAALRVLTPVSFLLLALILITTEVLFLARVKADDR